MIAWNYVRRDSAVWVGWRGLWLHGAASRVPADATAYVLRDAGFNTLIAGQWTDRTQEAATMTWVRETFTALEPYAGLRKFVTISARTKRPAPRQSPSMVRIWRGSGTEAQI